MRADFTLTSNKRERLKCFQCFSHKSDPSSLILESNETRSEEEKRTSVRGFGL